VDITKKVSYTIPQKMQSTPIAYPNTPVKITDYKNIKDMLATSLMLEIRK